MEKEHLIIIAILAVILYMCMNKSEKFYGLTEEEGKQGTLFAQRLRYGPIPPHDGGFAQNIRYGPIPPHDGGFAQRIRRNDMNIMGSQYITGHIRNDRRNNMMNSMMYGCDDPQNCGSV